MGDLIRQLADEIGRPGAFVVTVLLFILPIAVLVVVINWHKLKRRVGTIRCRRCDYSGPPKGMFKFGQGLVPVCPKCQGDDWVSVDSKRQ